MSKLVQGGRSAMGWSTIGSFLKCPQAWAFENLLSRDTAPTQSIALARGTLVHAGLAQYRRRIQALQQGDDLDEWQTPTDGMLAVAGEMDRQNDGLKRVAPFGRWEVLARELFPVVLAYVAHYSKELKTLSVEQEYTAEYAGAGSLTARVDWVVEHNDKVLILDTKTTSTFKSMRELTSMYALSGQMLHLYHVGVQNWGDRFAGVWVDAIFLNGPKFYREPLPPSWFARASFPATVQYAFQRLEDLLTADVDVWNYPKVFNEQVCTTNYRRADGEHVCEFAERCLWGTK